MEAFEYFGHGYTLVCDSQAAKIAPLLVRRLNGVNGGSIESVQFGLVQ